MFGPSTAVKLDLFHAVQNNTNIPQMPLTVSSMPAETKNCISRRWRHYTFTRSDFEKKMHSTVSEEMPLILKETNYLHLTVLKAVDSLIVHITEDCLSSIPSGSGTIQNEPFHQHIKSFFNKSKIGIFLAYALLTVIIHCHINS